ncbi:hypothetical protein SAMN05216198_3317 [Halopseudomonas litoralis]|uniref:Uncharacterized protein n=1 Tax=Halopseudomonas litoralis TaxID=797277 RepID=A0A1H1WLR3_9GAMM|nr:hypothetical protein SAMN05216198_3317 [Halopseudomonas litoralis]
MQLLLMCDIFVGRYEYKMAQCPLHFKWAKCRRGNFVDAERMFGYVAGHKINLSRHG